MAIIQRSHGGTNIRLEIVRESSPNLTEVDSKVTQFMVDFLNDAMVRQQEDLTTMMGEGMLQIAKAFHQVVDMKEFHAWQEAKNKKDNPE